MQPKRNRARSGPRKDLRASPLRGPDTAQGDLLGHLREQASAILRECTAEFAKRGPFKSPTPEQGEAEFRKMFDCLLECLETGRYHGVQAYAQDMAERPATPNGSTDNGSIANWEEIRSGWRNIRDRLELTIEKIGHKARREKYSKFDRYSYIKVIQSLLDDDVIRPPVAASLMNMNSRFLGFRRRTGAVTNNDVTEFKRWLAEVDRALPKLPELPDEVSE